MRIGILDGFSLARVAGVAVVAVDGDAFNVGMLRDLLPPIFNASHGRRMKRFHVYSRALDVTPLGKTWFMHGKRNTGITRATFALICWVLVGGGRALMDSFLVSGARCSGGLLHSVLRSWVSCPCSRCILFAVVLFGHLIGGISIVVVIVRVVFVRDLFLVSFFGIYFFVVLASNPFWFDPHRFSYIFTVFT